MLHSFAIRRYLAFLYHVDRRIPESDRFSTSTAGARHGDNFGLFGKSVSELEFSRNTPYKSSTSREMGSLKR